MKPVLILVRGLPGSGKSTYDKSLNLFHVEADMYHYNSSLNYVFNARNLRAAHGWALDMTRSALRAGVSTVVSNTFTTIEEMDPYMDLSHLTSKILIYTCTGNYGTIHDVPEKTLKAMSDRWENLELTKEMRL